MEETSKPQTSLLLNENYRNYDYCTSETIYEQARRLDLEGTNRSKLVLLLSTILAISAILTIGLFQYDEFFAYINDRFDYIDDTKAFCNQLDLANIDIVSTPIATFLIIMYILLYKRRVYLRRKFKYRNIGIPMVVSCWNKSNRLFSSFCYGLIAFNVFNIVRNSLISNNNTTKYFHFKDPTGLFPLLMKVIEVFFIGVRYYPVLVGT